MTWIIIREATIAFACIFTGLSMMMLAWLNGLAIYGAWRNRKDTVK